MTKRHSKMMGQQEARQFWGWSQQEVDKWKLQKGLCTVELPPQCHQRPNLFRFSHRSWHLHPRWAQRWNPNRTKTSLRIVSEGSHRLFPLNCLKSSGRFGRTWRHTIAILALNHKSCIRSTIRICPNPLPKPFKKSLGLEWLEWSVTTNPRFAN